MPTKQVPVNVQANTEDEARAIEVALGDPTTRAFVLVMGALLQLPTDRARRRVLRWAADKIDEESARAALESVTNGQMQPTDTTGNDVHAGGSNAQATRSAARR